MEAHVGKGEPTPAEPPQPPRALFLVMGVGMVGASSLLIWAMRHQGMPALLLIWMLGGAMALLGLLCLIDTLPDGLVKTVLLVVVGWPYTLLMTVLRLGYVAGNVAFGGLITLMLQWGLWAGLAQIWLQPASSVAVACFYLAAVGTLSIAAYWPAGYLAPSRFVAWLPWNGVDSAAERRLRIAAAVLATINPRRLAYQLTGVVYLVSVAARLADLPLPDPSWQLVLDVALEVLITFLALDSYLATFHPGLLAKVEDEENVASVLTTTENRPNTAKLD